MAGPGDERAVPIAGSGQFRASHADRERAIEVLKTAFVEDQLSKDEFDLRVDHALASRTYAELATVTGDLRAWPAAAGPTAAGPPSTPARTLAKAARRSAICVLVAFALVGVVARAHAGDLVTGVALFAGVAAVIAASGFLGYGVVDAWQEHRARGQLPPRRRDGGGLEAGWSSSTARNPAPPRGRPDQTRADLRTDRSQPGRPHPSGRRSRAPQGMRPVLSVM